MILTASLFSWEFAPQVFVMSVIMCVGICATFFCEVDTVGIYTGQTWENNFDQRKAKVIKVSGGDATGGVKFIHFVLENEHLERKLPKNLFVTQYKRISLK